MDHFDIRYKQGNANLDEMLSLAVAINELYQACKATEYFDGINDFAQLIERAQNMVVGGDCLQHGLLRKSHYVLARLVPSDENPQSLTLDQHLRNPDGSMYEGKDGLRHRCAVSVGEEGEKLIQKYGAEDVDELRKRFNEEFQGILTEDHGLYEDLMFEFFLKNLHLMKSSTPQSR